MPLRPVVFCEDCSRAMVRHCKVLGCGWLICLRCDTLFHLRKKFYLKILESET